MLLVKTSQDEFDGGRVEACAGILRGGGVGVVPTDTVYGIAALAADADAVSRVMELKRRAEGKPLPVLVATAWDANFLAEADSPAAVALIEAFWPGALTVVMPRRPGPELAFQEKASIGLRMPDSPFCLALIVAAGYVVAPSANVAGERPPVRFEDVDASLLEAVDFAVDAGECPGGVASTVVDITTGLEVLREGAVPAEAIRDAMKRVGEHAPGGLTEGPRGGSR